MGEATFEQGDLKLAGVLDDPGAFLRTLAENWPPGSPNEAWQTWYHTLLKRDAARDAEIDQTSQEETSLVNPVWLCQ